MQDTAGQERFASLSSVYSRGASAAIMAYDVTDRSSFEELNRFIDVLKGAKENCVVVVVGMVP